jgi:polysaccharide chain length determinant protein (PEP-CTERM system associated)
VFSSVYDKRIMDLKQRLDSELLNYTNAHPSVKEINTRIWLLKKLKKDEIESFKKMSDEDKQAQFSLDSESPIVQDLQIKISELESNAFSLKVKAENYETRIGILRGRIDMIPAVEAQLTELSRTYDINKKQYDDLLTRRESAQISNSMEEQTDNIHFKIIDPPRVPTEPVGPKRLLFLLGVTLIAFGSGIGLSFLHSQIAPVVITSKQISKELNLPVYGESYATVSSGIPSKEMKKKWIFITSNFILLSSLLLLLGWYMKDMILLILSKVI